MSTSNEKIKDNTYSISQIKQDVVTPTPKLTESSPPKDNTAALPPQKGRTVPSSKKEGSVRLRYAPRDTGQGGCESSTEA